MDSRDSGVAAAQRLRRLIGRWRPAFVSGSGSRDSGQPTSESSIAFVAGLTADECEFVARVQPFTLTSPERIIATRDAVEYAVRREIPGAFAECGVWRGGMVLAMLLTFQRLGVDDRDVYLYDTFDGMTEPTEADLSPFTGAALPTWREATKSGTVAWQEWFGPDQFNLTGVRRLLEGTGYPPDRIHFVEGRVEDTIPTHAPGQLAVLRLDTDWYESTSHELVHLYPRLATGGVLIVDDYGHWEGCRRAVDEYFSESASRPLLARIDYTARLCIKHGV